MMTWDELKEYQALYQKLVSLIDKSFQELKESRPEKCNRPGCDFTARFVVQSAPLTSKFTGVFCKPEPSTVEFLCEMHTRQKEHG